MWCVNVRYVSACELSECDVCVHTHAEYGHASVLAHSPLHSLVTTQVLPSSIRYNPEGQEH